MVSTVLFKVLPLRGTFFSKSININEFFLSNNKAFINNKKVFCSASGQSDIEQKERLNKFFFNQSLKNVRKYQSLYLENSPRYSSLLIPKFSKDYTKIFLNPLFEKNYDELQAKELFGLVEKELQSLRFEELLETIYLFLTSDGKPIANYQSHILKILNNELMRRQDCLTIDESLKMFMILCYLKVSVKLRFYWKEFWSLTDKIKNFTLEQVVYYIYIFYKHEFTPLKEQSFYFLAAVNQWIPQLNAQELGIVSLGLSHTDLVMSHPGLLKSIIKRTISQMENLTSEDILSISHFLFTKASANESFLVLELQEKLIPYLSNYKTFAMHFIALSGAKMLCLNYTLFDGIINLMKKNFQDCDAVALTSIAKLFVLLNRKDDEFLEMAVKKFLENADECSHYLISFVKCLMCLGIYEKNLIEMVMSDKYINYTLKIKSTVPSLNFLYVDGCLRVDNTICDVPVLDDATWRKFYRFYYTTTPRITYLDKWDSSSTKNRFYTWLRSFYDSNLTVWQRPLGHHFFLYVMRFDRNLNPQPIPKEYKTNRNKPLMRPLSDDYFWVPIILIFRNLKGNKMDEMNYAEKTRFRQYKAIGYKPVKIFYLAWLDHLKQGTEEEYFKSQLNIALQEEFSSS